jgi:hypothetical protein
VSTSTTTTITTLVSEGRGDVDFDGNYDTTDALLLRAAVDLDNCPLSYWQPTECMGPS